MIYSSVRSCVFVLMVITLIILFASFYFEYVEGLNPCPLCLMQRLCVILILPCTLFVFFVKPIRTLKLVLLIQAIIACAGAFFSGRQLWLQLFPSEQISACLPGLKMMIHYLPWKDLLRTLLLGAGDCAEVSWRFFGLTMAAWALLYFSGVLLVTIWMRSKRSGLVYCLNV